MEKYIYNEENGLWYELKGDYYIPCFKLPEEEQVKIGIWGQRHLEYIKHHRKGFYTAKILNGEINHYLVDIDKQAEDMFNHLIKQTAKSEGITEQLKAENQMEWVGRMNNIKQRVTEMVNNEIIYFH